MATERVTERSDGLTSERVVERDGGGTTYVDKGGGSGMGSGRMISRVRSGRWPPEAEDMMAAMDVVSAPYYGLDAEQIWANSRGLDRVSSSGVEMMSCVPVADV